MSYILTALKKSQQQRDRGAVPTLTSAAQPAPAPRRRPWSWLMAGGLALNVAAFTVLAWWLGGSLGFGESTAREVARVATPVATEQHVATGERSIRAERPISVSAAPKAGVEARRTSTTPQGPTRQSEPQAALIAEALQPAESMRPPEPAPVADFSRREDAAASSPKTSNGAKPSRGQLTAAELEEAVPAPKAALDLARAVPGAEATQPAHLAPKELPAPVAEEAAERSPEPNLDPHASLPMLHNLSYTIRTVLPDLSILVHVYGEEPRDRFVIIQSKKYREGDVLAENLALEAITPSGAVLRYKDTAFQIKP